VTTKGNSEVSESASRARQEKFQSILRQHGVVATCAEKGHDIAAACGQLRPSVQPRFCNS
jgi:adenine C2-methylase RlmN of 23S rRNA A2503 and tRNA A37